MAQFRTDQHRYLTNNDTVYEVVMLADQYGNRVGPANPSGVAVDAFGRARHSTPLTLFDSSHRYNDNALWATNTTGTASATFNQNHASVDMTVGTALNDEVIRETYKVFSYQPGKSLLIMSTVVFSPAQANLRQRVGYYGAQDGIYFEQDGSTVSFVERSHVTGSTLENRVAQSSWSQDKLDGTGPSRLTLDTSKAQIFWMDIEWLGLGSVRTGFVINGQLIHCHTFHHANIIDTPYITTASLPLRYEIKNTGTTTGATLKQICSTVISEGGYELRGRQQAAQLPVSSPRDLTTVDTLYPVVSIRLKSTKLDAIAILTAVSILGITNNANYRWEIRAEGTTTGGTWTSASANDCVEYNISGTSFAGGRTLASGYTQGSNQGAASVDLLKEALFKFQLDRDSFTGTARELTLVLSTSTAGADVLASMDWEEVTR
jgi:predicted hotdog family 3-hydroxylacyl-ACP dehydratase